MPVDSSSLQPKTLFQGKRQLKQDLERLTQEMYRHNKELADTNRTLSLLRAIDEVVLASHTSMKEVCMDITGAITEATGYPFVGLFIRSPHNHDELALYGWSARDKDVTTKLLNKPRPMHLHIAADNWFSESETEKLFALSDLPAESLSAAMVEGDVGFDEIGRKLGLKVLYLSKLIVRHHLVGLLVIGFEEPITTLSESDPLLDRLTDSVGVALDNKLLFEENQYVLRQLSETNQKLRELDDIKDDFISMASHQLRTPLTSVKGYLSMIIDGDAGRINQTQDKMLHQAFISAQRMVFLITDLLNVSRLKTGKFIIDAKPTDLVLLIQEEVEQLTDTAKAKGIKLRFTKPVKFPRELMLDEVKVRQVVMNFIDNAIYYTPSGGHIDIELVERPRLVELHVIDDGIGVPRAEQHHLFGKFYRAANARKARPDGTGLGLFMAQKVIVAQGGSVLFHSKEGQGSTFGFSFPKDKLRVPPPSSQPTEPSLPAET